MGLAWEEANVDVDVENVGAVLSMNISVPSGSVHSQLYIRLWYDTSGFWDTREESWNL